MVLWWIGNAVLLFVVLWFTFSYLPMAHMVWGKGGLLNAYLGGRIPTFDFAGVTRFFQTVPSGKLTSGMIGLSA